MRGEYRLIRSKTSAYFIPTPTSTMSNEAYFVMQMFQFKYFAKIKLKMNVFCYYVTLIIYLLLCYLDYLPVIMLP